MLPVPVTRRESDVLHCLADGLDDSGKRPSLAISTHTISRHIRNLCKKCSAKNSVHLIAMFVGAAPFAATSGAHAQGE